LTEGELERVAEFFRKTLEYWKNHNPKKYKKFWRDYKKLKKVFGFLIRKHFFLT